MSLQRGSNILIASSNPGKLREFERIFSAIDVRCKPQSEFAIDDAVEDGLSFVENAIIKARHAAKHSGMPALADDSGLEVPALNGAPGIYSARYSGADANDASNNAALLNNMRELKGEQRRACFQCVLVLMRHELDPTPLICQGTWWGSILDQPRGAEGFGYDPLFYVEQEGCTSAELPRDRKNQISHRGRALQLLIQQLAEQ
ncbi:MAG: RdgB/HAM1 family non-canonical purine NTP pyrophosphatase [Pseudomonadales bacterium]